MWPMGLLFSNYVDLSENYVTLSYNDVDLSDITLTSRWQSVSLTLYKIRFSATSYNDIFLTRRHNVLTSRNK